MPAVKRQQDTFTGSVSNSANTGLIEHNAYSGVVVHPLSEKFINDTLEVRSALEVLSVTLAAKKIDDSGASNLQKIQKQGVLYLEKDNNDWYLDYDTELHYAIVRLSGNLELEKQLQTLWNTSLLLHYYHASTRDRLKISVQEHGWIVESIIAGNADVAASFMQLHYANGCRSMISNFRQSQQKSE